MFPSFDSWTTEALKSHQESLNSFMLIGGIVYGVLTVLVGGYIAIYNVKLSSAIESSGEPRANKLTPANLRRLAERLNTLPKKSVAFVALADTKEAQDFANKLFAVLEETGALGPVARGPRQRGILILGIEPEGFETVVFHDDNVPAQGAVIVRDALVEAGIADIRLEKAPNGLPPDLVALLRISDR